MAVGSLAVDYSPSVMGTALAQPPFVVTFSLATRSNANALIGLTTSMLYAGGFFGSPMSPYASDIFGRRLGIALPTIIFIVSAALLAGSVNIGMFIVFRFTSGFATFALLVAIPVWMSEVSPPNIRGALVTVHNFAVLIGFVIASCESQLLPFILQTQDFLQSNSPINRRFLMRHRVGRCVHPCYKRLQTYMARAICPHDRPWPGAFASPLLSSGIASLATAP